TPAEILAEHGIRGGGNKAAFTSTCPRCSHTRPKKRTPCLSVLIDDRGVRWHCHHCSWKGGQFYDEASSWSGAASAPAVAVKQNSADDDRERKQEIAVRLWSETVPLSGTLGEHYFLEHRKIDITGLDLSHVLRWHAADLMIVTRMSDPLTGE